MENWHVPIREGAPWLCAISVPMIPASQPVVGADGTSFEFSYGDNLFVGLTLKWWSGYPKEWSPFTEAVIQIGTELENRRKKQAQASAL